jgi:hypothetical protein
MTMFLRTTLTIACSWLLLTLGLTVGCAQGGIIVGDDDAAGDDDASSDDDDASSDDDDASSDDDDASSDDDDASSDDDDASDDDDDVADDDDHAGCEWDGSYNGITTVDMGYWPMECPTEVEIDDCDIRGNIRCEMGWDEILLDLSGEAEAGGDAFGMITGEVWGEVIASEWLGSANPGSLEGEFIIDMGWETIPGWFELYE